MVVELVVEAQRILQAGGGQRVVALQEGQDAGSGQYADPHPRSHVLGERGGLLEPGARLLIGTAPRPERPQQARQATGGLG